MRSWMCIGLMCAVFLTAVLPVMAQEKAGISKEAAVKKLALDAAMQWLDLVDREAYADSWEQTAKLFRERVTLEQWETSLTSVRTSLGGVISREPASVYLMTSLPGAPDGQYVVIQFNTVFENKENAIETVTPMFEKKAGWRVSGYYIR